MSGTFDTTAALTGGDRLGTLRVRLGIGRDRYAVDPGLYRVGDPGRDAPVLVTANYKLTFDHVRSQLVGIDAWLLVLDTRGINVWCAAGKNTFGTVELARRVVETGLADLVDHRTLIVPQLGATGVAAHDVKAFTGFRVLFGPVRATDLPTFLGSNMSVAREMRRVTFTLRERLVLVPVEFSLMWRWSVIGPLAALVALAGFGAWGFSADALLARGQALLIAALAGWAAGGVLVPVLLPWIPGRAFALKGALAGIPVAIALYAGIASGIGTLAAGALSFAAVAIASFAGMNFTGSSTFTSLSGVLHEMRRALPWQLAAAVVAAVMWVASAFLGRDGDVSGLRYIDGVVTLELAEESCTGCGMCVQVCPHAVFEMRDRRAVIADLDACMECGACVRNCAFGALAVDAGVGCAAGIIAGWIKGTEPTCGSDCC